MKCPHCGSDELFYTKDYIQCSYKQYYDKNGRGVENALLESAFNGHGLPNVKSSEYLYCDNCNKRVGKSEEIFKAFATWINQQ